MKIQKEPINNGLKKAFCYTHGTLEYNKYIDNETMAYCEHIRTMLPTELAFNPKRNVFKQLRDGVVLAYALNEISTGCIDLNMIIDPINMDLKTAIFEATANLTLVLHSANKIGIVIVNIGPEDILNMKKELVLSLLWQIVRLSVTKVANIKANPELLHLWNTKEKISDINESQPEDIMLRWINFHLKSAGKESYIFEIKKLVNKSLDEKSIFSDIEALVSERKIRLFEEEIQAKSNYLEGIPISCRNFSEDISDSRIYIILMKQIAPRKINYTEFYDAYFESNTSIRATKTLRLAEKLGCNKFIKEEDIILGDPKLNFLFVTTLFNSYIALPVLDNSDSVIKENLNEIKKTLQEKEMIISELKSENNCLRSDTDILRSMEVVSRQSIESLKEMYDKAIQDNEILLDSFTTCICEMLSDKNYRIDSNLDAKEKILKIITLLLSDLEQATSDKDKLHEKNRILIELNNRLKDELDEIAELKANEPTGLFGCCFGKK